MKYLINITTIIVTLFVVSSTALLGQCDQPITNTNSNITISGEKTLGQTFVSDCMSSLSSIVVQSNSPLTSISDVTLKLWEYSINSGWTEIYSQGSIVLNGLNVNTTILISGDNEIDYGNTFAFTLEHATIDLDLRAESVGGYGDGRSVKHNMISTNFTSTNDLYFEVEATSLLPVELVEFYNLIENNQVHLNWTTKFEEDNLGFEVQKSEDGIEWNTISFVNSLGDSNEFQNYNFVDRIPVPGKNYYRLKQIDFDGSFEFSEVSVADLAFVEEAKIYPNPAVNKLMIYIPEIFQRRIVRVFDIHGKEVIATKKLEQFNLILDVSSLVEGVYLVKSDKIPLGWFVKKRI